MKLIFVGESGIYGHWREAFKKHAKSLADATSVMTCDLSKTRMDHADLIIYFDDAERCTREKISLNIDMIFHAVEMYRKGVRTIMITRNRFEEFCRIWDVSTYKVIERDPIGMAWYAFHTDETGPARSESESDGFNHVDWADFERRFILDNG